MNYHPNLLKVFTQSELDLMIQKADYSLDKDGFVNVMLVRTSKIFVEIFVDCEAQEVGHALIALLYSDDKENSYPSILSKEFFWKVFCEAEQIETCNSYINLEL
jgi:hypothetical protein